HGCTDGGIFGDGDDLRPDHLAQLFDARTLGSHNRLHSIDDRFQADFEDGKQECVFIAEMVIQAGGGEIDRCGDVFHGGGFVAVASQHVGSRHDDVCAVDGLVGGFACQKKQPSLSKVTKSNSDSIINPVGGLSNGEGLY